MAKQPRNVPDEITLRESLEHLRYEFASILLPITDYPLDLKEVVEFWHLSHTRLLIDFFGCHTHKDTDLIYTDYFTGRTPVLSIYGSEPNQEVKDYISRKLLHLTAYRVGKKSMPHEKLWPTARFMSPIKREACSFIEDVIQGKLKFQVDTDELAEWVKLQSDTYNQTALKLNTGNVAYLAPESMVIEVSPRRPGN